MDTANVTIQSPLEGLKLDCIMTKPQSSGLKGIVQIVHGMAEHKERYLPLMNFLSLEGYVCIISDTRGHGKSVKFPSDLGYFYGEGADGIIGDVLAVNKYICWAFPDLPVFLLGHSMGSLIARWYLHEHADTIKGLFLVGTPGYNPAAKAGKALCNFLTATRGGKEKGGRKVSSLVHKMAIGQFGKAFPGEAENSWICSDPEVVKEYNADPLCGFPLTLDGYNALMELMIKDNDPKLWKLTPVDMPVIFLSGNLDPCMGEEKSILEAASLLTKGGFPNTEVHIYPGMRHEILNEKGKEKVFSDILGYLGKWIDAE
ncbi:MAG: alpha/beta fold hydrolase [Bacteroidales bacterium]|nr:alpha/beta fold hydrolase [Bacteroidales bacterium]